MLFIVCSLLFVVDVCALLLFGVFLACGRCSLLVVGWLVVVGCLAFVVVACCCWLMMCVCLLVVVGNCCSLFCLGAACCCG